MVKIGLALSGGGSRGSFHIGVLAAFDALGIAPSIISGTSAGALVGSLYAAGVKPDQILEIANNVKWYNLLTTSFAKNGITNLNFLENLLTRFIPGNDFKDLKFPFLVTATNMNSGGLEIFETGEVHKPVMASCSVPLLFRPISMNGNKYLDGGIVMNLPVSPLIDRCDIIVASNLFPLVPRQD
ncbi:MAG TPA: patatin-like phospholipase family protein, partial [Saprospiraceae bacterium]|nr:patatin-like phospholipase family protein [Saprospiraceae bacterium]